MTREGGVTEQETTLIHNRPLAGRTALVTGAARNIGRAIAVALAEAGAVVTVSASRPGGDLEETARQAGGGHVLAADLTDPDGPGRLVTEAIAAMGRLDILVNNAAIRPHAPFHELSLADWRRVMAVNLDAAFLTAKAARDALCASGAGRIVNISGVSARIGAADRAHVMAAKAGLEGFTRALAVELGPLGVTANAISPALIDTERAAGSAGPDFKGGRAPLTPLPGYPEDIARAVLYLAGESGRYVTGQVIHVGGGLYMGA